MCSLCVFYELVSGTEQGLKLINVLYFHGKWSGDAGSWQGTKEKCQVSPLAQFLSSIFHTTCQLEGCPPPRNVAPSPKTVKSPLRQSHKHTAHLSVLSKIECNHWMADSVDIQQESRNVGLQYLAEKSQRATQCSMPENEIGKKRAYPVYRLNSWQELFQKHNCFAKLH